ncbi:hypothetical protein D3C76_1447840 [compost metagenome]
MAVTRQRWMMANCHEAGVAAKRGDDETVALDLGTVVLRALGVALAGRGEGDPGV